MISHKINLLDYRTEIIKKEKEILDLYVLGKKLKQYRKKCIKKNKKLKVKQIKERHKDINVSFVYECKKSQCVLRRSLSLSRLGMKKSKGVSKVAYG
jgi:hypothetical protein